MLFRFIVCVKQSCTEHENFTKNFRFSFTTKDVHTVPPHPPHPVLSCCLTCLALPLPCLCLVFGLVFVFFFVFVLVFRLGLSSWSFVLGLSSWVFRLGSFVSGLSFWVLGLGPWVLGFGSWVAKYVMSVLPCCLVLRCAVLCSVVSSYLV